MFHYRRIQVNRLHSFQKKINEYPLRTGKFQVQNYYHFLHKQKKKFAQALPPKKKVQRLAKKWMCVYIGTHRV